VSALELQARVLLRLERPTDVISLADTAIRMAAEMGCLPMLWRIHASKAQAMAMLGRAQASRQAYQAAAAILLQLADAIPDADRRHSYLSSALVSSILGASKGIF
jgi:hypothetical protein